MDYEAHYMDDYLMTFPSVDEAKFMGHEIVRRFEAAGIRVNKRKCKVIPLTKPFRFCKARFTLTETRKGESEWKPGWSETGKAKAEAISQRIQRGKKNLL